MRVRSIEKIGICEIGMAALPRFPRPVRRYPTRQILPGLWLTAR
jgi:hypothetical protein